MKVRLSISKTNFSLTFLITSLPLLFDESLCNHGDLSNAFLCQRTAEVDS